MRFHDEIAGTGRIPKLEEWLSLIGEKDSGTVGADSDWACLVTFANQKRAETARQAGTVRFSVVGDAALCRIGEQEIRADLSFSPQPPEGR